MFYVANISAFGNYESYMKRKAVDSFEVDYIFV